jgi:MoaA/NifB/PqqE/SkfB family radical SAM enzyme
MDSSSLLGAVRAAHDARRIQWNGVVVRNREGAALTLSRAGQDALGPLLAHAPGRLTPHHTALLGLVAFYLLDVGQLSPLVDYGALVDEGAGDVHPSVVSLEVTRFCNLRCLHCYNDSGRRPADELSADEKRALVTYLLRWGVRGLTITGGEPTLEPSFPALLELAGAFGASVKVTTNGWALPAWFRDAVRGGTIERVDISLDGADEDTHDLFRARRGSFARVLESMAALADPRPAWLQLNVSVHAGSLPQMDALVRLALEHGFDAVSFKPVTSTGRRDGRTDFFLAGHDVGVFREQRARLAATYGDRIRIEGNILGGASVPEAALDRIGCNAAQRSMLILANGKMTPCDALAAEDRAPSVRALAPMRAWLSHPLFGGFRSMKQGEGGATFLGCPGMRFARLEGARPRSRSLEGLLRSLAERLDVGDGVERVRAFLSRSTTALSPRWPDSFSPVAPGPVPVEISFSQANAEELRILAEPCRPGEGIAARAAASVTAVGAIARELFSEHVAELALELVRRLLPDGQEIGTVSWQSAVWLALKADRHGAVMRVYVNGRLRDADDRWRRMGRALSRCGHDGAAQSLAELRHAVGEFIEPIGLCLDIDADGPVPARLHGVTDRMSPYRLLRLLQATHSPSAVDDVADFLEIFDLLEARERCPLLISFGLGRPSVGPLKIDVDLWGLEPDHRARAEARYVERTEARFGPVASYRKVASELSSVQPRYLGITASPGRPIVNVYFPCPDVTGERRTRSPGQVRDDARRFVVDRLGPEGGLPMDARSILAQPRHGPPGWIDPYMTALLVQELDQAIPFGPQVAARARAYLLAARDGWAWRYLPDLPCDLDDTAMAWLALEPGDRRIDDDVVNRLEAMLNDDGGFPTFIGGPPGRQPSHPAVTVNVALALDRSGVSSLRPRTDAYLRRWLFSDGFPTCEWSGALILPLFLCARASGLRERLGPPVVERLVERTLTLRRDDGSWGRGLPDSLDTSLAVVTLALLGVAAPDPDATSRLLRQCQLDDGGWGWSPLYGDGAGTWFGQRAISTLFAMRALRILGDP